MTTLRSLAMIAALALPLGGCMYEFQGPFKPPLGNVFNATSQPTDITFDRTEIGTREGRAASELYFWMFSMGDCSVDTAARNGGLQQIDHIDSNHYNIFFGLYTRYETIAVGR